MKTYALALLFAISAHAGEINLVAQIRTFFADGAETQRVRFAGTAEDHHVSIDSDASIEKLADGTRFTFQKISTAIVELRPSPVSKDKPIATENLPEYRKAALAQLPVGNRDAKIVEETPDAHPINGWKSLSFTCEYTLNGAKLRSGVTYVTLAEGPQILMTSRASAEQFEGTAARANSLIRSWFTLKHNQEPRPS